MDMKFRGVTLVKTFRMIPNSSSCWMANI